MTKQLPAAVSISVDQCGGVVCHAGKVAGVQAHPIPLLQQLGRH